MGQEITYTTAPEAYDSFGTKTLAIIGTDSRGNSVRKVASQARHAEWQRGRYGSGLYMVADEAELQKLVRYGLVKLQDSHT
jgi:hypothetical protein